jgi:hypothetical protein
MEKNHILSQIKAFIIDALQAHSWVSAVLNSERHEGNASVGTVYTDVEQRQIPMNNFDPLKSFEVSRRIHDFFAATQLEGVPRWNKVRFTLPGPDHELTYETWLDQQIDDEIRFYDAGGEVDEWQDIEDERDAFFANGSSKADWRLRIEQLIANKAATP